MKTILVNNLVFGLASLCVFSLMLFVSKADLPSSLYVACGVLLMNPSSREGLVFSVAVSMMMTLACICVEMFFHFLSSYAVVQIATSVYVCTRGLDKYYFSIDKTMSSYRHWNYLEDACRLFCLAALLSAGFIKGLVFISLLTTIMGLRCITGCSVLVLPSKERKVKAAGEILNARKNYPVVLEPERESDIFEKIEGYMRTKKPYLEEDFCMEDICTELLTNKLYVSKTINDCFEDNFRAYLNGYRIDYAKSIINGNPKVKMSDVATMSGYRCLATFNSSFKEITGMTPGDYSRQEMARQRLSRTREQEP